MEASGWICLIAVVYSRMDGVDEGFLCFFNSQVMDYYFLLRIFVPIKIYYVE